jgi:hypothetical protein
LGDGKDRGDANGRAAGDRTHVRANVIALGYLDGIQEVIRVREKRREAERISVVVAKERQFDRSYGARGSVTGY